MNTTLGEDLNSGNGKKILKLTGKKREFAIKLAKNIAQAIQHRLGKNSKNTEGNEEFASALAHVQIDPIIDKLDESEVAQLENTSPSVGVNRRIIEKAISAILARFSRKN